MHTRAAHAQDANMGAMLAILAIILDECVDLDKDTICAEDEARFSFLSDDNPNDAAEDEDEDNLTNAEEINIHGSNPDDDDSDDDGRKDGEEIDDGSDPNDDDTDDDNIKDGTEFALGLNVLVPDAEDFANFSDTQKRTLHVLNRLSFGPTQALLDDVDAVGGIDTWVTQQLTAIPLPAAPARDATEQPTFENYNGTVTYTYPGPYLCGSHTSPADPAQAIRDCFVLRNDNDADIHSTIRPMHSIKQLQSRMTMFWDNHFSTDLGTHGRGLQELLDEDDFFVDAFGAFRDLLDSNARSYSMLEYLDLDDNRKNAPNENYPREVKELHTVSIDGGYDAQDIAELSRILTGWDHTDASCIDDDDDGHLDVTTCSLISRYAYDDEPSVCDPEDQDEDGDCFEVPRFDNLREFIFKDYDHDDGTQDWNSDPSDDAQKILTVGNPVVQTLTVASMTGAAGETEGINALNWLAAHPNTAEFICTKLAQEFISDDPLPTTISDCATVFLNNAGTVDNTGVQTSPPASDQIGQVLANLFASAEFDSVSNHRMKLKDTQESIISLARILQWKAAPDPSDYYSSLARRISNAEQRIFYKSEPTGYYETSDNWLNTNILLNEFEEMLDIVFDSNQNFQSDAGTTDIVDYFKDIYSPATPTMGDIIEHLLLIMFGGYYDGVDIQTAFDILNDSEGGTSVTFDIDAGYAEDRLLDLIATYMSQPEFHLH